MSEQNQDKHQQRQQKVKEKVDERIAAAQKEQGIFQVITGNGKGKSTSGFGTVARAVGHGMKSIFTTKLAGNNSKTHVLLTINMR